MALLRDGWVIPSRAAAWGCARKSKIEQYCVSYLQKLQNGDRFYYLSPFWCLQQNFISKFIVILSYLLPNLIAYTEILLNYTEFIHKEKWHFTHKYIKNRPKLMFRAVLSWWSPRDGTRTPKIIVLRDYVVLRIAV